MGVPTLRVFDQWMGFVERAEKVGPTGNVSSLQWDRIGAGWRMKRSKSKTDSITHRVKAKSADPIKRAYNKALPFFEIKSDPIMTMFDMEKVFLDPIIVHMKASEPFFDALDRLMKRLDRGTHKKGGPSKMKYVWVEDGQDFPKGSTPVTRAHGALSRKSSRAGHSF